MSENNHAGTHSHATHIVSYREHASTFLGLILLTVMTVTVSVFGADLYMLTVLTALTIASAKAIVVALYFMHLKYDPKIFKFMLAIVVILFIVFIVLAMVDYALRS
jgi:cytochrome c oxidase subunit IV